MITSLEKDIRASFTRFVYTSSHINHLLKRVCVALINAQIVQQGYVHMNALKIITIKMSRVKIAPIPALKVASDQLTAETAYSSSVPLVTDMLPVLNVLQVPHLENQE